VLVPGTLVSVVGGVLGVVRGAVVRVGPVVVGRSGPPAGGSSASAGVVRAGASAGEEAGGAVVPLELTPPGGSASGVVPAPGVVPVPGAAPPVGTVVGGAVAEPVGSSRVLTTTRATRAIAAATAPPTTP